MMSKSYLEARIAELPQGGITYKTISGKRYAYYQWTEGGKQHARRVKDDEIETLQTLINERKSLQQELSAYSGSPQSEVVRDRKSVV